MFAINRSLALRSSLSAATVLACVAGHAAGTVLNWNNAAGGTLSTAANWNPVQAPTAADDLIYNVAGAYFLTSNPSSPTSNSMDFRAGNVTLQIVGTIPLVPGSHTIAGSLTTRGNAAAATALSLTQGTLRANNVVLGSVATAFNSSFTVSGSSTDLIVQNGGFFTVGSVDNTSASIVNGGRVEAAGSMRGGLGPAVTDANLVVDGTNASGTVRSSLDVLSPTIHTIIASSGDFDFSVLNGAISTVQAPVTVATAGGTGTITVGGVGGAGPFVPATLSIANRLDVGTSQTAGTAGGTGTVTVNDGGAIIVAGLTRLGGGPTVGGSGVLRINSGGTFATNGLTCDTAGDLQHIGGTLNITGGTFINETPAYNIGNTALNDPLLILGGNAQMDVAATTNGGTALRIGTFVGGPGGGDCRLEGGADLRVTASSPISGSVFATIGDDADDRGDMDVVGTGTTFTASSTASQLNVGLDGDATLDILSGGLVDFDTVHIAANPGSTGTVTVDAAGSRLRGRGRINVGGDTSLGGLGRLIVRNSGVVEVTENTLEGLVVFADGTLEVGAGAQVNVPSSLGVRAGGQVTMTGGTINADRVIVTGATFSTSGTSTVNTDFLAQTGSSLNFTGNTTIGDAASTAGIFTESATMNVGGTVSLLDSDTAFLGNVVMQGGTLLAPDASGVKLQASGTQLSGEGTLDCRVSLGPSVTIAPTGLGLTFADRLTCGTAATHAGTEIRLASAATGSFFAQTFNTKWTQDIGSIAIFSSTSSVGDNTNFGVTINGSMLIGDGGSDVATERLTLRDSNGLALGTLTAIAGGELICASNLTVNSGRTLRGEGRIATPLLSVAAGIISPDNFDGPARDAYSGVGTLRVSGNYSMGATSRYKCEIAFFDFDPGEFNDRINITGNATLNGTLEIVPLPTYDPASCHDFTIMTYLSRTGTFSNIIAPPGYSVVVEATRVRVLLTDIGCDSIDFNGNGVFPEDQDVIDFFNVLAGGVCPTGTCQSIDFNNNCVFPEDQDVIDYFTVLAGGTCSV